MNPNLCRIVLRPRSPLAVFDLTWRLLAERGGGFIRLFLLLMVPVWAVSCVAGALLDWHWGIAVVLWVVAGPLRVPFTLLAGRLMFADVVPVGGVLREVLLRTGSLLGLALLHAVSWVAAVGTCGISLVFTMPVLAFTPECLLLEQRADSIRRGGSPAARRSYDLAQRSGIGAIAAVAGTVFLTLWFAALAEATGTVMTGFLLEFGSPFGDALKGQATPWILFGILAAQPVIAAYRLLLYVDVRTRSEGWDLQVTLRALGMQ